MWMGSATATRWSVVRAAVEKAVTRKLAEEHAAADTRRAALLESLRPLALEAIARGLCRGVWLFGSFAWGHPGSASDVDLLVDGDADAVSVLLSEHLRLPLHVVAMQTAPDSLRERVLRDGQKL